MESGVPALTLEPRPVLTGRASSDGDGKGGLGVEVVAHVFRGNGGSGTSPRRGRASKLLEGRVGSDVRAHLRGDRGKSRQGRTAS